MTVQPLFETLDRPTSATANTEEQEAAIEGVPLPTDNAQARGARGAQVGNAVASNEAIRSVQMRTQFLRRVAHDIASPTGVTMTVLEELACESSRPELVAMARRGLRRLLRLSEQLALAADVEAGTLSPDATLEDVRTIVKDALEQAVTVDGRRDIVTSCEVPDEKLAVEVDRRLLSSLLREVIGNALRLASSRVAIDIALVPSALPAPPGGGKVTVRVQDDGPGFSNEALTTLGQRFTPGSTNRGLGLSLSLAKDILAVHRGELTVEVSSLPPGRRGMRGAAVIVTLPLAAPR